MVEYGVIGVLLLMSIVALWATLERLLFYKYIKLILYANKIELEIDLSKNLTLIATIGSNAPYVGLLERVWDYHHFCADWTIRYGRYCKHYDRLALALQATAGGLLVAIPSIIFYNLLTRKSEVLVAQWEIMQEKRQIKACNEKVSENG